MELEEVFNKWIEWKLYKILYIGILIPLLFEESKRWISQNPLISITFFVTIIILLLPLIFKVLKLLNLIVNFFERVKK